MFISIKSTVKEEKCKKYIPVFNFCKDNLGEIGAHDIPLHGCQTACF
jgi:hypothetical protein